MILLMSSANVEFNLAEDVQGLITVSDIEFILKNSLSTMDTLEKQTR